MLVRLVSGQILAAQEGDKDTDTVLERRVRLVYSGTFQSMDGEVTVEPEHLARLVGNHNSLLAKFKRLASGDLPMKAYPPLQLDHSPSAMMTVGRVVGPLELAEEHELEDGSKVTACLGRVRFLGKENVEKARDGRWTHFSVGADFDDGTLNELSVVPFPAASQASMLASGDLVMPLWKFKNPEPGEEPLRFIMIEDRGDRALYMEATLFGEWAIKPTFVYKKEDLVKSGQSVRVPKNRLAKGEEGEPVKEKLKAHLMRCSACKNMSAEDAEKHLAALSDEDTAKLAATAEEHDKAEEAEKTKLAAEEEEKKRLAAEEEAKKEEEKKKAELAAKTKAGVVQLAKDFRASAKKVKLEARKAKLAVRLSALRSKQLLTPAEMKAIDLTELAGKSDEALEAFFKGFEIRQPVIPIGQYGSAKGTQVSRLAKDMKERKLMAESAANMPFTGKTVAKRLAGEETAEMAPGPTQEMTQDGFDLDKLYAEVQQLQEGGKHEEARAKLKALMERCAGQPSAEAEMSSEGTEKRLSALAQDHEKLQNQFEQLLQMVAPMLGVETSEE